MSKKGNWTEKDEVTIHAIIVNMLNQKKIFQNMLTDSPLPDSFGIKNPNEYILGIFTGIVINLFANYWIGEHEAGLTKEDLSYLYQKISFFQNDINFGLFD